MSVPDRLQLDTAQRRNAQRVLTAVSLVAFATSLFTRAVDPIIPPIARDLGTSPATVALLSTAFSLPFALVQPVLGPLTDMVGKTRIMSACLLVLIASAAVGVVTTSFPVLLASRVVAGMAAGGVFPSSLALVADLVPVSKRQIALGRYLAVIISGNFLGASLSGVVADWIGWRGVFLAIGGCGIAAFLAAQAGFRQANVAVAGKFDLKSVPAVFRTIFANPRAKVCYAAVFLEGVSLLGVFPFVALLLGARGEPRASIAGLVIGGFALGGVVYSLTVRILLGRFPHTRIMALGAALAGLALLTIAFRTPWPVEMAAFVLVGMGFYMLHGSIQVEATEIAPASRGAAMSLHSLFFFLGQAAGPVFYGFGFAHFGAAATIVLGAAIMVAVGTACSRLLRGRVAA